MSKVKPPAFQFYADDFVAGTVEMTTPQIGAYILLLCYQWSKGYVPDNDDAIRQIARMAEPCDLAILRAKFAARNGKLFNARLERERKKQKAFRVNRSASGKKGAESRWLSHNTAITQPMAKNGSPSPSPSSLKDSICASAPPSTATKFKKPEQSELELYAGKLGLPVLEISKFMNYYESNGWRVGRNPMKSWQAAMSNWKNNLQTYRGTKGTNNPDAVGGKF